MGLQIEQYVFPIPWWADRKHRCQGLTLTQIGQLPGGLIALDEFANWSPAGGIRGGMVWDAQRKVRAALQAEPVAAALKAARLEAAKKPKRQRCLTTFAMAEKQKEFGW